MGDTKQNWMMEVPDNAGMLYTPGGAGGEGANFKTVRVRLYIAAYCIRSILLRPLGC